MQSRELQTILQRLNKYELTLIIWYVRARWLRHKVGMLHPVHVLFPATILQVIILICATSLREQFITIFAIGNLTVALLAMFPSMIQPRHAKVHWVR